MSYPIRNLPVRPSYLAGGGIVAALAIMAVVNRGLAKRAERTNPPMGRLLSVDGFRLHVVEHGEGEPLVLLHGNGSMIQDFASSGLIELAARNHRVIVFDRPGFGHSDRPRLAVWTPQTQAKLIYRALRHMGIERAKIVGHSWGASVALAYALRYPEAVKALVLVSGYYYATPRTDVAVSSAPAVPVLGDVIAHTVAPIVARLIWPQLLRKIFGPANIPAKFGRFPKEMAVRPSQLRASAAETAMLIPNALGFQSEYRNLKVPVAIVAGEADRFVDTAKQSGRLHREIEHSTFSCLAGVGHMVHQTATAEMMAIIDEAGSARGASPIHSQGRQTERVRRPSDATEI